MKNLIFCLLSAYLLSSCSFLNISPSKKIRPLSFETDSFDSNYQFFFPNAEDDLDLVELRANYPIESLVENEDEEQAKVLILLNWVRNQWEHNGWNNANTNNAFTILERAKQGEKFRCVEYGIVLKSALASIGMKSRTLGLMTRDVEKVKFGAGHVLAEVWLDDLQKWALVDAQFDVMPTLDNVPLNAVELQAAIIGKKPVKLINLGGEIATNEYEKYMSFIPHYLYYFNISFNEAKSNPNYRYNSNGKSNLILVPLNNKKPEIFQRKNPIDYAEYTYSLADFYRNPNALVVNSANQF